MSTLAPPFFLLFWLLRLASTAFPEEPEPLNFISIEVVHRYPVFLGRPHRSSLRQEPLHIQRVLKVNRTLYIGARYVSATSNQMYSAIFYNPALSVYPQDDLFRVELDNVAGDEMFYSKVRPCPCTHTSHTSDILQYYMTSLTDIVGLSVRG
ncbi:unnamed protein product [Oncorhynchus mykiss]|uniref:Uncharacterized protein n=1 Tax=Oncorhynchus mykiss TaxID=8022 RepID=A0A060X489_ONCMY|nr:unnamed protein product [Oncorhynchus mykiss]